MLDCWPNPSLQRPLDAYEHVHKGNGKSRPSLTRRFATETRRVILAKRARGSGALTRWTARRKNVLKGVCPSSC
jgi:hypothetical protein